MAKNKLLSFEEEQELFRRYNETKDPEARDKIICSNLNLVKTIARNYVVEGVEYEDLVSEGYIGLIKAVEKFDYKLGNKFSTYAFCWIKQTMIRYINNNDRTIRLPAHAHEKLIKINKFISEYETEYGNRPTDAEIAEGVGMSESAIKEYVSLAGRTISLQTKVGEDDESELGDLIEDDKAAPEEVCETKNRDEIILHAVNTLLNPKERYVIERRFGLYGKQQMKLSEVGDSIGMSKERVRQIEANALRKLRQGLAGTGLFEGEAA